MFVSNRCFSQELAVITEGDGAIEGKIWLPDMTLRSNQPDLRGQGHA